jgi:hypothetical protein
MKVERFTIQACCGRTSIIFKLDRPIASDLLAFLVSKGFTEDEKFTKAGMLYVDNPDFILVGALGADKLQAKCKPKDCTQKLNELEELLLQME